MNFHTEVVGCYWQEHAGQWSVKLREHLPGHEPRDFEDHCDVLLYGAGVLDNFKVSEQVRMIEERLIHRYSGPRFPA